MASFLKNKHILVGITGGIAAYKAAELVRMLRQAQAQVRVVMTPAATAFITPLTLQALSGLPVSTELLDEQAEAGMGHIELARWADAIVVAPATADALAKFAHGEANDLLSTLWLASDAIKAVVPAMNQQMWADAATQANLALLKQRQIAVWGPASGEQACGDVGLGRMLEPLQIVAAIEDLFTNTLLGGVEVLLTAGATQEALDPVRYLTNHSSGKMGYALADALIEAGANVTLVTGITQLAQPARAQVIEVTSALEMYEAVMQHKSGKHIFIATAAVADYRPAQTATHKIKKSTETMTLELIRNPDILQAVALQKGDLFCVGFAAQTDEVVMHAKQKLIDKKLDMIIANQVGICGRGFGADDNQVTVLYNNKQIDLPLMSKTKLARELVSIIAKARR